ncbi:hypothetical protein EAF00_001095 [Botryotinia globosa]|nr:hypothetical protein EAF00_001095 [Botryotinia globosa]
MRAQGREPRLSSYSMSPRNDQIPNTIHGLAADSGMAIRGHEQRAEFGSKCEFRQICPPRRSGIDKRRHHCFVNRRKQFGLEDNITFRAGTYGDFLRLALRNFDHRDGDNCRSANATVLIWLARRRLCRWYSSQEPVAWDQLVEYRMLEDEAVFQPRRPFRCYFQVFGSAKGEGMGMRDATAGGNYYPKWLGAKEGH